MKRVSDKPSDALLLRWQNGGTEEDNAEFWSSADATKHNRDQGLAVYLTYLERFHGTSGAGEGKFTASGISVGECKLWTTLHVRPHRLHPVAGRAVPCRWDAAGGRDDILRVLLRPLIPPRCFGRSSC